MAGDRMNILVLDDDLSRIQFFREAFGHTHNLWIATSAFSAIKWLQRTTYDVIFLDHDLLPEHYSNEPKLIGEDAETRWNRIHNKPGTGREVSRWLAAHPEVSPGAKIAIHSWNETGREVMRRDLEARGATVQPFGSFGLHG